MTTSTPTLTTWLLEQIAADETVARGAYRDSVDDEGVCHEDWTATTTAVMWGDLPAIAGLEADYLADHIATHDPERVLAQCAAFRAIVDEHRDGNADSRWEGDPDPLPAYCTVCHDYTRHDAAAWPCPTLRALASIYKDRPGWQEAWG